MPDFMQPAVYRMKLLSALEKVFPDQEPVYRPECTALTALRGETVSFQIAYIGSGFRKEILKLRLDSPAAEHLRVRSVELVPVGKACNTRTDDNYLSTASGLYPDLLRDLEDGKVTVCAQRWRSVWVDLEVPEDFPAGTVPIKAALVKDGEEVCAVETRITVLPAALPPQTLIHTEWLHTDCLCDYYHLEPFSEEFWPVLGRFLEQYRKRGGNMILTPLFTLPLDTAVGEERTTTQLVGVTVTGEDQYEFDFSLLRRWIHFCRSYGMEWFEMSHLFSQWGAVYPPKVVATVDGEQQTIFGWHTSAVGAYTAFLHQLLPQLTAVLREEGIAERTYFHLSDEPREQHLESYRAAKESIDGYLDGFLTFDALSSYEFYRHGLVKKPIPGNNEIEEFLAHGLTDMWTYYCTGQCVEVSNRFMAMPSARNRIIGVQLYKFDIIGFLHWGYNFYNSQFSYRHIDPYQVTDADYAFPSGDPFLVYPGPDGAPEESIRQMVFYEALCDLRALRLLESLTSREHVLELIEDGLGEPLTFKVYPKSDAWLLDLRRRVNREIAAHCG